VDRVRDQPPGSIGRWLAGGLSSAWPTRLPHMSTPSVWLCLSVSPIAAAPASPMLLYPRLCEERRISRSKCHVGAAGGTVWRPAGTRPPF
jgi:hypothetical protein